MTVVPEHLKSTAKLSSQAAPTTCKNLNMAIRSEVTRAVDYQRQISGGIIGFGTVLVK